MTNATISPNRLTSSGKLDSSAAADGGLLPVLLGRMDVSAAADDTDLLGSTISGSSWTFNHSNSTLKKYTDAGGDPYVRAVYPDMTGGGTATPSINFLFAGNAAPQEFYFQFYARRDGSIAGGSKFVKAHDLHDGGANYSNMTWNNGYGQSNLSSVGYGDGTGLTNDSGCLLYYNTGGTYQTVNRPVEGTWASGRFPSVMTPLPRTFVNGGEWLPSEWGNGTQWHKFQMRIKVNTGSSADNEVNDGVLEVWIDGVLRCAAYNIMCRHYGSSPFSYLEFMSLSQAPSAGFTLEMKKITVSKYGWID